MYTAIKAVGLLTVYLVVYLILWSFNISILAFSILFLLSPFLMFWAVYCVLKEKDFNYPEMDENEEWGYLDKTKTPTK